jgi:hypothetical protein
LEHPQNLAGLAVNPFGKALLPRQNQICQIDALTRGCLCKGCRANRRVKRARQSVRPDKVECKLKKVADVVDIVWSISDAGVITATGQIEFQL